MKLTLKKKAVKQLSNDVNLLPKKETAAIAGGLASANKTIVSVVHSCVCKPSEVDCF
ncbi:MULTISPECIES: hypothetical protein [Thalassomonas]|uniref:Uncharacterized protein n=1 Tax=Thalassomonas actiniarum TaxID=485447 RepID=A0AAE9YQ05_9GAMM|nr:MULTISPECIES: hypothetical protein [Thalassomonas]WDD98118.1 hypothetical protein SG35_022975 [Thalassomonas actiniarum]